MKKLPTRVGSRELKTRLGMYLKRVQAGETILVTDRGEPVAELRPLSVANDPVEAALQKTEAEGLLTRGTGGPLTPFEPIRLRDGVSASDLIRQERDEGW
jgi:prevent-host-death family protein